MHIVLGLIIGAAVGAVQFLMLSRFTAKVTESAKNAARDNTEGGMGGGFMLTGIFQWILPFAALILVGLFYRDALMWAGVGMATVLIVSVIVKIIMTRNKFK